MIKTTLAMLATTLLSATTTTASVIPHGNTPSSYPSVTPRSVRAFTRSGNQDDCTGFTFTNLTTPDSPLISDCQTLVSSLGEDTYWNILPHDDPEVQLISYGSCHFTVSVEKSPSVDITLIGNHDVVNVIHQAVAAAQGHAASGDLVVAAEGDMSCLSNKVHWYLKGSGPAAAPIATPQLDLRSQQEDELPATSSNPFFLLSRQAVPNDNLCGASTFVGYSRQGSPQVKDCEHIAEGADPGNGTPSPGVWTPEKTETDLIAFHTCLFGITLQSGPAKDIGYKDVQDLIYDSIKRFKFRTSDGSYTVEAGGILDCKGSKVSWRIHS